MRKEELGRIQANLDLGTKFGSQPDLQRGLYRGAGRKKPKLTKFREEPCVQESSTGIRNFQADDGITLQEKLLGKWLEQSPSG